MARYAIGIDFGTESGRAVLVDVATGEEVATSVYTYRDGVIDEVLPDGKTRLEPDWALQNPQDYLETVYTTIPALLRESGARPEEVVGIGIDFTSCTMMPTLGDGTPLCFLGEFKSEPHAWTKLWKHHAAQPEADELNRIARERGEAFLRRYGGKISSEWFFPKVWQILDEAPHIYEAAGRMIEGADWIVWQLTGRETRNSCTAGYKAIWDKRTGFPSDDFFRALDPRLEHVVDEKMSRQISPLGTKAGGLTKYMAERTGLLEGTPVAVGNVDAHVSVPAATVVEPWKMVMVMGTSICHMVLGTEQKFVEGMCGVVEDGILPGYFGYEAGQSAVGDIFAWFVEQGVPGEYRDEARRRGISLHKLLEEKAARLRPGESGLLAIDWWNGNRSILVDADLSGLLLGMTLATKPEEVYRALIEATAFGTRTIIDAFEEAGVPVEELYACGGLPERNRLLMQIYADVTGREIEVAASSQAGALGSAMFGAVAAGSKAGGYDNIVEAAEHMAHLKPESFKPVPDYRKIYEGLYEQYRRLHDYFGRGENDVMKYLKALRRNMKGG
ncbi:MAG: ribulokinase [Candidatus Latescibacterota bacterium]|nr:MAG: ribulokinase [Candidatus Latescibacterota bacterium]